MVSKVSVPSEASDFRSERRANRRSKNERLRHIVTPSVSLVSTPTDRHSFPSPRVPAPLVVENETTEHFAFESGVVDAEPKETAWGGDSADDVGSRAADRDASAGDRESGTRTPILHGSDARNLPRNKDSWKARPRFVTTAVYHLSGLFGRQTRSISRHIGRIRFHAVKPTSRRKTGRDVAGADHRSAGVRRPARRPRFRVPSRLRSGT